ncbi:Zinc transporter 3, partial [Tetrabaena socialis]
AGGSHGCQADTDGKQATAAPDKAAETVAGKLDGGADSGGAGAVCHQHVHVDVDAGSRPPSCSVSTEAAIATNAPSTLALRPSTCASPPALEQFRLAGMAALFELGCVFHSFLIGLMLGTAVGISEVRTLLIVLSFHQFLEGLGLVSVLMAAGLGRLKLAGLILVYALTCPVGIAVGVGIADSYDSHSVTARAVQGTVNGVSSGVLLYLATMLVGCEFGSKALLLWRPWQRLLLFGLMCLGAGGFAVLALWA